MNKWWWVGVIGVVIGLGVVAYFSSSPARKAAPGEAGQPTPGQTPPPVIQEEVSVEIKGKLVENEPGTARVGYSVVAEKETVLADLSEFAGASVAAYLDKEVVVTGPRLRRRLYNPREQTWYETETRYMLVKEIKFAP